MTKHEFLEELKELLLERGLSAGEAEKSIEFYAEMIDDRIEDGMSEKEATAALGSINEIADKILYDTPLAILVKSKMKQKKETQKNSTLLIILAVLGSPIWLSLFIALLAVFISFYVVVGSLILSVFTVVFAVGLSGILLLPAAVLIISENHIAVMGLVGAGLILVGLSVLLFFPAKYAASGLIRLSAMIIKGVKSLFIGKSPRVQEVVK